MRLYSRCHHVIRMFILVLSTLIVSNFDVNLEPNDIFVEESRGIGLIATLILIGGTIGLFLLARKYIIRSSDFWAIANFAVILGTPPLAYQAITKIQRDRIRYFNTKKYG